MIKMHLVPLFSEYWHGKGIARKCGVGGKEDLYFRLNTAHFVKEMKSSLSPSLRSKSEHIFLLSHGLSFAI